MPVQDDAIAAEQSVRAALVQLFIFMLLAVPVFLFLVSLILGAFIAAIEDWTLSDGFFFIAALAATATNPIVSVVPATSSGTAFSAIVGAWALAFMMLILSMLTGDVMEPIAIKLGLSTPGKQMSNREAICKCLGVLLIVLPLWNFFWSAILGGPLAAAEGWAYADGFWFSLGVMTASTTGYTSAAPGTPLGMVFSVLFDCWSLSLAAIGLGFLDSQIAEHLCLAIGFSAGVTSLGCSGQQYTDPVNSPQPSIKLSLLQLTVFLIIVVPAFAFLTSLVLGGHCGAG
uniref:Potassium channel domain-containing protein n=1 Tax=Eutreptiella gymnastica TaxID=73025 RepID=A0A7S1J2W2_9EUGL